MSPSARAALRSTASVLLLLLAVSCSAGPPDSGWVHEESTRDGIPVVRTLSGSVWGGTAHLEEVLVIGPRGDDPDYLLGNVATLLEAEGRIYVLDAQEPTVRVYDAAGEHVMDIGRKGQGPGEFLYAWSMAFDPGSGNLLVRDGQLGRINAFHLPDGAILPSRRIPAGRTSDSPMVVRPDGSTWSMQLIDPGTDITNWVWGPVLYDSVGAAQDTLWPPSPEYKPPTVVARKENSSSMRQVPFSPSSYWTFGPTEVFVSGTSTDYVFEIRRPDGSRVLVEKAWDPVPVADGEGEWRVRSITLSLQRSYPGWAWNGPGPPRSKPAFSGFIADRSGRVWVERPGPGIPLEGCDPSPQTYDELRRNPCWRETVTWDVFDSDGRFLGPIDLPDGLDLSDRSFLSGDTVLALWEDADGTPYVKKYRIVRP